MPEHSFMMKSEPQASVFEAVLGVYLCHRRMSLEPFNIGVHRMSLRTALNDFCNLECIACLCGLDAVEVEIAVYLTSYSKPLFELVTCRMSLRTALLGIRMSLRTAFAQKGENNFHRRWQ